MFTTPCFIRNNTPELREKLEKLGYTCGLYLFGGGFISIDNLFYLRTHPTKGQYQGMQTLMHDSSVIDCGTNEQLFLALAAMRDDNDYMQWFVHDELQQWVNIDRRINAGDMFIVMTEHNQSDWKCHKASVKEIIEHFTMEGGAE